MSPCRQQIYIYIFSLADTPDKMATLQQRLQNQDYSNWVKAGLCIALTKKGLEGFTDEKSKDFHTTVVDNIRKANFPIVGCSMCNTGRIKILRNKGAVNWRINCGHPYCEEFLKQIELVGIDQNKVFRFDGRSLRNSNIQQWHSSPWELAKLFMNHGQQPTQQNATDTDFSGIINFIDHCQTANNDIANPAFIQEVRNSAPYRLYKARREYLCRKLKWIDLY